MLWKEAYRTAYSCEVVLPNLKAVSLKDELWVLEEGVFLLGFDLFSIPEIEIWKKLLRDINTEPKIVLITPALSSETLRQLVPLSEYSLWGIPENPEEWSALFSADRPERSFALFVQNGTARLVMAGAPTEDAWEIFEKQITSS